MSQIRMNLVDCTNINDVKVGDRLEGTHKLRRYEAEVTKVHKSKRKDLEIQRIMNTLDKDMPNEEKAKIVNDQLKEFPEEVLDRDTVMGFGHSKPTLIMRFKHIGPNRSQRRKAKVSSKKVAKALAKRQGAEAGKTPVITAASDQAGERAGGDSFVA